MGVVDETVCALSSYLSCQPRFTSYSNKYITVFENTFCKEDVMNQGWAADSSASHKSLIVCTCSAPVYFLFCAPRIDGIRPPLNCQPIFKRVHCPNWIIFSFSSYIFQTLKSNLPIATETLWTFEHFFGWYATHPWKSHLVLSVKSMCNGNDWSTNMVHDIQMP